MTGAAHDYYEHSFKTVIPGDVEAVRQRLCEVLEDFNYSVLSETPIQATRPRQKNIWVATVLEYDIRLDGPGKRLRPIGEGYDLPAQ